MSVAAANLSYVVLLTCFFGAVFFAHSYFLRNKNSWASGRDSIMKDTQVPCRSHISISHIQNMAILQ